jgi:hypothetical protein
MDSYVGNLLSVLQSLDARISGLEGSGRESPRMLNSAEVYSRLSDIILKFEATYGNPMFWASNGRHRPPFVLQYDSNYNRPHPDRRFVFHGNQHDVDQSISVDVNKGYPGHSTAFWGADIKCGPWDGPVVYRVLVRARPSDDESKSNMFSASDTHRVDYDWRETVTCNSVEEVFSVLQGLCMGS